MMNESKINALLELERRGELEPEKVTAIQELRQRGEFPAALEPAQSGGFFDAGKKALRTAEFASRGVMDSAMETVGAIPDAVASGMRYVGLPAPEQGFYTDKLKQGVGAVGKVLSSPLNAAVDFGGATPADSLEKGAYGAGRGVADAASFMAPGAALAKYAKGVPQAVGKAMTTAPVVQATAGGVGGATTEVTGNPYLGAAAAMATPLAIAGLPRVVTPVGKKLSAEEARLAALFEKEGGKLTAGQATGSRPLQAVESTFTQLPLTGRSQHAIYDAQREAFSRMVLGKAGVGAKEATPEVIDQAYRRIGSVFDDIASRTSVRIDKNFSDDINAVVKDYGRRLPRDVAPVFKSYLDDINQAITASQSPGVTKVTVDGATYKNIASDIRRAARNARSNPDLQTALVKLGQALDDAMGRSVPKELKGEWAQVRRDYRNLLMVDGAMAKAPQGDMASGNIPFGALKNAVRQADPKGFARGRGEMNDMARIGSFLGSTRIPDSGTAVRSNTMRMLQGGPLAAGGTGAWAMGGSPEMVLGGAAVGAGASLGLPKIAQVLMNSDAGQAYLRNNLIPPVFTPSQMRGLLADVAAANQIGQAKQ